MFISPSCNSAIESHSAALRSHRLFSEAMSLALPTRQTALYRKLRVPVVFPLILSGRMANYEHLHSCIHTRTSCLKVHTAKRRSPCFQRAVFLKSTCHPIPALIAPEYRRENALFPPIFPLCSFLYFDNGTIKGRISAEFRKLHKVCLFWSGGIVCQADIRV